MKEISIKAERMYKVLIGAKTISAVVDFAQEREKVAVIFSQSMKDRIPKFVAGDSEFFYFEIPDGEAGKSAATLHKVWDWLGASGFTRSDAIVAIGGGAVTDFAGFAAASWLRGIEWLAIPTTVAGMVDAAIGGKTGINSDYGKNLIGAFHSPTEVIIDFEWLATLSDRDFSAGLAEVVKCGFIQDPYILQLVKKNSLKQIRANRGLTEELVERAIAVKAQVVSGDFREGFDREILNYGHTFGHAVELHCKYSMRHGECVSIGMMFIAHLSQELGLLSSELVALHEEILQALNLPIRYQDGDFPQLLAAMRRDKKSRGNNMRFVVITDLGKTQRLENPSEGALLKAYEKICQ